jgi:hypothetical protein
VALDSRFVANQSLLTNHFLKTAEGVGFEPTRACALPVFKTGAINHSTTPPRFSFEKCAIDNSLGKPRGWPSNY